MLFYNILFLCLVTIGSMLYVYKNRSELSCMDGMIMAMAIGAMSSLTLGLNLEVYWAGNLTLSTIVAVVIGMVAGFFTGIAVSLMASIDGALAGVMGGMMSPMLAAMLSSPMTMVWFLDIVYIVVLIMLVALVREARQAFREEKLKEEAKRSE